MSNPYHPKGRHGRPFSFLGGCRTDAVENIARIKPIRPKTLGQLSLTELKVKMLDLPHQPTRRQWVSSLATAAALKSSAESVVPFERIDTHTHIHRISPPLFEGLEE